MSKELYTEEEKNSIPQHLIVAEDIQLLDGGVLNGFMGIFRISTSYIIHDLHIQFLSFFHTFCYYIYYMKYFLIRARPDKHGRVVLVSYKSDASVRYCKKYRTTFNEVVETHGHA